MNELKKAVFFDRDGVINKERKDYVKTVHELEIFPNVAKSIKLLKNQGFSIVVVSNQSAINRGYTNHDNVKAIHNKLQEYLLQNETSIDAFYYCPHRPDENCECRKPKPGLLLKAIQELKIDPSQSWIIGNNESDITAGKNVGCRTIKIDSSANLDVAIKQILDSTF